MKKYIFDVDGTLTPSRQTIDPEFGRWFLDFVKREKVWLVTGSDYPKTVEQLGKEICENVATVYNCSGNDIWFKGKRCNAKEFNVPEGLEDLLKKFLSESQFHLRTGNHIEHRRGTINFSVVGRNANQQERNAYIHWDTESNERIILSKMIEEAYPNIRAMVGGETGIDIYPVGWDKSQILTDFNKDDEILFFGDKMEEGGNDYPLAKILRTDEYPNSLAITVKDWQTTYYVLRGPQDGEI